MISTKELLKDVERIKMRASIKAADEEELYNQVLKMKGKQVLSDLPSTMKNTININNNNYTSNHYKRILTFPEKLLTRSSMAELEQKEYQSNSNYLYSQINKFR